MRWPRLPTAAQTRAPDGTVDERALMGVTAGYMWLLTGATSIGGLFIPGSENIHPTWVLVIGVYAFVYGIGSVTDRIPWSRVPIWQHQLAIFGMLPVLGVAFWATGGARSYTQVLIAMPLIFIAYFFRGQVVVLLVTLFVAILAAPLVYDPDALSVGYPGRFFVMVVVSYAVVGIVLWLKRQLVAAEARQREISLRDPLTGIANRRAFDAALDYEVARASEFDEPRLPAPTALIFFDLDRFKEVNDLFGHPVGDTVLQQVAERCAQSVRPADTLARIGGDEFAVVSPRAGVEGAERIVNRIRAAVGSVKPAGDREAMSATVVFSMLGEDATTVSDLIRVADQRLHHCKRGPASDESRSSPSPAA